MNTFFKVIKIYKISDCKVNGCCNVNKYLKSVINRSSSEQRQKT